MPTLLLDEPDTVQRSNIDVADRLRTTMAAVRICFTWFGTRKSLSSEQKAQAAESFGAQGQFLTAGKKLLDSSHPAFKAVTAVRGRVLSHWRGNSLPFPEPGLRLIRQADIAGFDQQMSMLKEELENAVETLDAHFHELRAAARQRLGSLYNPGDYPVKGTFL